jgi:glycosyltransferase involved in cell wall biosynthesis
MSISVVIPVYNAAGFIAETLDSVLRQTLPADEILVIDDGSTDDTATVAESFGSPVRVIRRPNCRQAASRNFGVREAKSEWIAFVDADDKWQPSKLARQMEELARNPLADLCYTARVEFVEQGGEVKLGKVMSVPPPEDIRQALFRNTTFMPSSVVIRRSTFLAAGGFDAKFQIVEDWDFWLRLLHAGTVFAACQEALLLYRIHPKSVSHDAIPALAEAKQIYQNRVLPHLPKVTRWFAQMKSQSGQEAAAAYVLRGVGDPRHLTILASSILRYPFNDAHRYKVFAHMLYTRLNRALG